MDRDIKIEAFRNAVIDGRLSMGLSRRDLSLLTGVSESTIKRFESGGNITMSNYLDICKELEIKIDLNYGL